MQPLFGWFANNATQCAGDTVEALDQCVKTVYLPYLGVGRKVHYRCVNFGGQVVKQNAIVPKSLGAVSLFSATTSTTRTPLSSATVALAPGGREKATSQLTAGVGTLMLPIALSHSTSGFSVSPTPSIRSERSSLSNIWILICRYPRTRIMRGHADNIRPELVRLNVDFMPYTRKDEGGRLPAVDMNPSTVQVPFCCSQHHNTAANELSWSKLNFSSEVALPVAVKDMAPWPHGRLQNVQDSRH